MHFALPVAVFFWRSLLGLFAVGTKHRLFCLSVRVVLLLVDSGMMLTREDNGYRLTNTGQGLNRVQVWDALYSCVESVEMFMFALCVV